MDILDRSKDCLQREFNKRAQRTHYYQDHLKWAGERCTGITTHSVVTNPSVRVVIPAPGILECGLVLHSREWYALWSTAPGMLPSPGRNETLDYRTPLSMSCPVLAVICQNYQVMKSSCPTAAGGYPKGESCNQFIHSSGCNKYLFAVQWMNESMHEHRA